jgi:hypothetical protein
MGAWARPSLPGSGDVVMLDLRQDRQPDEWDAVAEGLQDDDRPLLLVADQPRHMVGALGGRVAGTLVLTGAESDAGYRVALTVCRALRTAAAGRLRSQVNGRVVPNPSTGGN